MSISRVEARNAAKHPTAHRTAPSESPRHQEPRAREPLLPALAPPEGGGHHRPAAPAAPRSLSTPQALLGFYNQCVSTGKSGPQGASGNVWGQCRLSQQRAACRGQCPDGPRGEQPSGPERRQWRGWETPRRALRLKPGQRSVGKVGHPRGRAAGPGPAPTVSTRHLLGEFHLNLLPDLLPLFSRPPGEDIAVFQSLLAGPVPQFHCQELLLAFPRQRS